MMKISTNTEQQEVHINVDQHHTKHDFVQNNHIKSNNYCNSINNDDHNNHISNSISSNNHSESQQNQVMCVECEDTAAVVKCINCDDYYCALCFQWQHRKGNRSSHSTTKLSTCTSSSSGLQGTTAHFSTFQLQLRSSNNKLKDEGKNTYEPLRNSNSTLELDSNSDCQLSGKTNLKISSKLFIEEKSLKERCKFIPLRITQEERALLHLLEGALNVSEYTDNVDVVDSNYGYGYGWGFSSWRSLTSYSRNSETKSERIKRELEEAMNIITGLNICKEYRSGVKVLQDNAHRENFLQTVFEVGRRYKIMCPEQMRTTYGKLMWILQDACSPEMVPFSCKKEIQTVYSQLKTKNCLDLLTEDIEFTLEATKPVVPEPNQSPEDLKLKIEKKINLLNF